ncbi:arginase [Halosimplex litoreum]|uniref:Arginase n=1 Tax=Halosimplex litoreum TaxID=1198301 RepID=A0A7T3FY04_9EURY|nr:arginase [Halosimplex litoreum]QPV62657.1 arginase [Halosimplex litoreum]
MNRPVRVFGAPMDLGADRRGVDMGPSAIRYAGLAEELPSLGIDYEDGGDVAVPSPERTEPDAGRPREGRAKYLGATERVCRDLADEVAGAVDGGAVPLVLGGDHSIAIGTVGGAARDRDLGIVWFDAHGDFNTPTTSPSGNVHGMSVAAILGRGSFADSDWAQARTVDPENVAMVGLRDLDDRERDALRESDVTTFSMTDIDQRGLPEVTREAVDVATDGTDGVHVSLDMDFLDPTEAPGVGTPVRGGASYREGHTAMELVSRTAGSALTSLEIVEVNPILDDHNRTAELAVELAASALGKRIL